MPKFSKKSLDKLAKCDSRLQLVCKRVIPLFNFTVIYGHRSVEEQLALFSKGRKQNADGKWVIVDKTKVVTYLDGMKKRGKHNFLPSKAVDLAPYPIDFSNKTKAVARFYILAGMMMMAADELGIKLRWGGDWDSDWDLYDQAFDDLGHFEVIG